MKQVTGLALIILMLAAACDSQYRQAATSQSELHTEERAASEAVPEVRS